MKEKQRSRLIALPVLLFLLCAPLLFTPAKAWNAEYKPSSIALGTVCDYGDTMKNNTGHTVTLYFYVSIAGDAKAYESHALANGDGMDFPLVVDNPVTRRVDTIYNWVLRYKDDNRLEFYPLTAIPDGTKYVRDMYNDTILTVGDNVTFQGLPFGYRTVNYYDGDTLLDTYTTPTMDFIFSLPGSDKANAHFGYRVTRWRVKDIETKKNNNVLNIIAYEDYAFADIIQARDLYNGARVVAGTVIDFTSLPDCNLAYYYYGGRQELAYYRPKDDGYRHIVMETYPTNVFAWQVRSMSEYYIQLVPDESYSFADTEIDVLRQDDMKYYQPVFSGTVIEFNDSGIPKKVIYYADAARTVSYTANLSRDECRHTVNTPHAAGFDQPVPVWQIYNVSPFDIELIPFSVVSGDSPKSLGTNLTYSVFTSYGTHTLLISGSGAMKNFTSAPDYGNFGFTWYDGASFLYVNAGVTTIGDYAFAKLANLDTVYLPETLTQIGSHAFAGCPSLKALTIPEGVTVIGAEAFSGCDQLEEITLPSTLTQIAADAFKDCKNLKTVHFGGTLEQFAAITNKTAISCYNVYFDGDAAVCYLVSQRGIGTGTLSIVAGESRYYFDTLAEALAAAEDNRLGVNTALYGDMTASDRVTLVKDIRKVELNKNIVIDLNGRSVGSLSIGTLPSGGTLYIFSSGKRVTLYDVNAITAYGSGEQSGSVVFRNIASKGYIDVSDRDFHYTADCDVVLNYFTVRGQDKKGSVTYDGMTKPIYAFYPEYTKFTSYITPHDAGASYPGGKKVVSHGAVLYYYTDATRAIADAHGFALSLGNVFTDAALSDVKNALATDTVTLLRNADALGTRGAASSTGRGKNPDGSSYGIAKGIVIDLNGHNIRTISAGEIPSGQILVIKNSAGHASSVTDGVAFDDESALGFTSGTVVFRNVTVTGTIRVANHVLYVDDKIADGCFSELKHNGEVYRGTTKAIGYVFDESADKWACYLVPKEQQQADLTYPNGEYNEYNGVIRYYYVDFAKALAEARAYDVAIATVVENGVVVCDTYADKIVLTKSTSVPFGTPGNNVAGYGIDANGNYYGLHKGIIIDMNGFNGKTVAPGLIPDGEVLLVTNTAAGESKITGAALDDESGTGFCTGKVVYNNVTTTGDFWVAGHEIHLCGNGNYATDGKMQGIYKNGIVYRGTDVVVLYVFDTKNSQWSCYIVPFHTDAEPTDYPESEMYEDGGQRYFFYKDLSVAIQYAKAGTLSIEDCIDDDGHLRDSIATDRVVLLKSVTGYIGALGENGTPGFGKNNNGAYYGIHKGIIIDTNGMNFESVAAGIIPDDQVLIITNSSPRPSVSLASTVLDDENGTGYCGGRIVFDRVWTKGVYYVAQHKIWFSNCNIVESGNMKDLLGNAKIVIDGAEKYCGDGKSYVEKTEEETQNIYEMDLRPEDFDSFDEYIDYMIAKKEWERKKQREERLNPSLPIFRLGSIFTEGDGWLLIVLSVLIVGGIVTVVVVARKRKNGTPPKS